jgi:hypothetical protein
MLLLSTWIVFCSFNALALKVIIEMQKLKKGELQVLVYTGIYVIAFKRYKMH